MRLLLLEDDQILGSGLRDFLGGDGDTVDWVRTLQDAQAHASSPYDVLLIDWQLPDGSGIDWIRALRKRGTTTTIIVMTARDQLEDRIAGLDAGADDFLVKPFAPEELSARIRACGRRSHVAPQTEVVLTGGEQPVIVDLGRRTVRIGQAAVSLTKREWSIIEALAKRTGWLVSRDDLESLVWGFAEENSGNSLEVHIANLRRKLGRNVIETVRGLGYRVNA